MGASGGYFIWGSGCYVGANGGFMGQLYALGCWCMIHGGCWRLCGSFIGAMGAVKGQDEAVRG